MKPSPQEVIAQIRDGQTVVFREPWYHVLGHLIAATVVAVVSYYAIRWGFVFGWLFLVLAGLFVLIRLMSIFMPEKIRLDRNGITTECGQSVQTNWSRILRFYVVRGSSGERWVSFQVLDNEPDLAENVEIREVGGSSFGFGAANLADLLNQIRITFGEPTADDMISADVAGIDDEIG